MNTKDSMVVSGYTQAAIERLKDFLLSTNSHRANIELRGDMLFVEFQDGIQPTTEVVQEIRKIFYWTDSVEIPHIDGFVHHYSSNNTTMINLVHYEEICKIKNKLSDFGAVLKGFDLNFHEYTFTYDVPGRSNLNFSELIKIEQIIDPKENTCTDHISVFRMGAFYTLTIKHDSWKY